MRLEGTLDAFGLPDILQLLAFSRKTGALTLSAPPRRGVVRVRDGAICAASSDSSRQMLARRVVGAGLVGDDALESAVRAASADERGVVATLLAEGAVSLDAVLPLATEQVTDAVGELLRWTSGEFSFVMDEPDPDGLPLQVTVDEAVAEGQRRLSVWAELAAVIPSTDIALALAVAPVDEPQCTREEWGLLALVDGQRTVREIVALLGRSEFTVVRSLAGLVARGLLVVPGAAGPGGGFLELHRRQALLAGLEAGETPDAGGIGVDDGAPARVPEARPGNDESTDDGTVPAPVVSTPAAPSAPAPSAPAPTLPQVSAPVSVSTGGPITSGANALAADLHAPTPLPAPVEDVRPTLTLAEGPQDVPERRSLLLRLSPVAG